MKSHVLVALALIPPLIIEADPIRWSEPRLLAPDTAAFVRQSSQAIAARDTVLWTVWAEDKGAGYHVLRASRFSNGSWLEPESITSEPGNPLYVKAAVDTELNPWVAWGVCEWSRRQAGSWTPQDHITSDTTKWGEISDLTSDAQQGVWAIWTRTVAERDSVFIYTSRNASDSWTAPSLVAKCPWWFIPYCGGVTAPPWGRVRSVWTCDWTSGIGIYSAVWGGDSWEAREPVPGSGMGDYPSVCSDSVGGTWVTWYDGWSAEPEIRWASHDGTAWTDAGTLAAGHGVFVHEGMLCSDEQSRVWALWDNRVWTEQRGSDSLEVRVRYFDGDTWSVATIITTCKDLTWVAQIAPAFGRVWVTWAQRESDDRWLLYYSHTLPSGVAEERGPKPPPALPVRVFPSPARDRVWLEGADKAALFEPDGRRAAFLTRGKNDIRSLSRGIYFVRVAGSDSPVAKVILSH